LVNNNEQNPQQQKIKMAFSSYKTHVLLLISMSCTFPSHAEKIYRWKDKNGNIHFGDKAQSQNASEISIKPASVGDSTGQQRLDRSKKYLDSLTEDRLQREQAREQAKLERKETAKKCEGAKRSLKKVKDAQFVYTETPDGEKNILSFERRAAEEKRAANKVHELCGKN
jgi:hypothetical protein